MDFYGHEVGSLLFTVLFAFSGPFILLGIFALVRYVMLKITLRSLLGKVSFINAIITLAIGFVLFILYLPNSFYLCLEIRHIIQIDTIADNREPLAVIVFGFMSLVGLLLTIAQISICAVQIETIIPKHCRLSSKIFTAISRIVVVPGLSIVASWGAVFGWVIDLNSWEVDTLSRIFTLSTTYYTPALGMLVVGMTIGLMVFSYGTMGLIKKLY